MMGIAMAGRELGPGERIARRNRRRMIYFLIGAVLLGGVLGGSAAVFHAHSPGDMHDISNWRVPPFAAVLLAIGFFIALVGVPLWGFRLVDEVKVRRNLQVLAGSSLAVLGGYPAWQALAAGGLLPQPSALGVFLINYAMLIILGIAFKIRG